MSLKTRKKSLFILVISKLVLLVILVGFILLPSSSGNDDMIEINQASLQVSRIEYMQQQALILQYRPINAQTQAISGLQITLPILQQVQTAFLKGDISLGIPGNPPNDEQLMLANMQGDYSSTVASVKSILAHPDSPPDPLQVDILLQHGQSYALGVYQLSVALMQHAESKKISFVIIEMVLTVLIFLDVTGGYFFIMRPVLKEVKDETI